MATQVNPNNDYVNSTHVSQKYNPFEAKSLDLDKNDKAIHSKMLTNRCALLKKMNVLPQTLTLVMTDGPAAEKSEVGKRPPLVVVSSNRSKWIAQGIAAAHAELGKVNDDLKRLVKATIKNFDNVNDFRALRGTAGQKVSPPIYCPERLGAAPLSRNVYVVVHLSEYENYKKNLAGSGITVVGWQFDKPKDGEPFVGFGASRFAAIEFCKILRTNVSRLKLGKVWDYAWLVDDNVVALEGFPGFEKVEDALQNDKVCSGFRGRDFAWTNSEMQEWARSSPTVAGESLDSAPKGILQQVGLWNIKYLTEKFLNFPPIYITSAEDISLNRYFDVKKIGYNYYGAIVVDKELVTTHDGDGGAVKKSRQHYANLFAKRESGIPEIRPVPPPPPPFMVKYNKLETSIVQFITTQLLDRKPEDSQYYAACQGVEQITKTAIGKDASYIDDGALTATFQLNGKNNQVLTLRNVK
jgi:hypothetical protein